MATNNPSAVANNASAIPGATTARFVFCAIAIDWKLFIIPQTVPNSPIKGAVEPAVAKNVRFFSITSDSLLKVTCIDLFILSFREFMFELFALSWILLVFFHSLIAEQNIFDLGSFWL